MTDKNKMESNSSSEKRGILKVDISDEKMLYNYYMPYVKGCGVFIPTEIDYNLGEEAFLLLNLPKDGGNFAVSAKVVWVNPQQKLGRRVLGVGVQILGRDADKMQSKITEILGKKVNSPLPTATM